MGILHVIFYFPVKMGKVQKRKAGAKAKPKGRVPNETHDDNQDKAEEGKKLVSPWHNPTGQKEVNWTQTSQQRVKGKKQISVVGGILMGHSL